ncbi:superoxide dismutase family protein [Nannocystis sp. ILAH1]|uniref:superoxide dismutase family protein n=1 Tax=unclassified Nannocystis TaxID=2627009 RepID=UPI00226E894F|nr:MULTISPECIES: superoxide dismutase family protein [unclassified Nannocystis]MCY0987003.1 superoxide dismutase family protein [Nannocystis sp. ILAH1]MCY1071886.1 superoxide dismutase family protein [Nannocystis sp. RBIL2]
MSHDFARASIVSIVSLILAGPTACGSSKSDEVVAVAELAPLGASAVDGTVTFTKKNGEVHVEARINGLQTGDHGFHIHEFGDCSAPDGKSAGEHFNPDATDHGAPKAPRHHAGDLGNLAGGGSGKQTTLDMKLEGFTLDNGPRGILGRSVVVHAAPDDYTSQPAGNSGARIACGVIRLRGGDTQPITAPK